MRAIIAWKTIYALWDIVEIVDAAQKLQDKFLAYKGLTMDEARAFNDQDRETLSDEFHKWREARKRSATVTF